MEVANLGVAVLPLDTIDVLIDASDIIISHHAPRP